MCLFLSRIILKQIKLLDFLKLPDNKLDKITVVFFHSYHLQKVQHLIFENTDDMT